MSKAIRPGATECFRTGDSHARFFVTDLCPARPFCPRSHLYRYQLNSPLDQRAHHGFKLQAGWKAAYLDVAAFMLNNRGETLQVLARPVCP